MRLILTVLSLSVLLALSPSIDASNLVQNGGFESGLASWNPYQYASGWSTTTTNPHSGTSCCIFSFPAGAGYYDASIKTGSYGISVQAGIPYVLSFWFREVDTHDTYSSSLTILDAIIHVDTSAVRVAVFPPSVDYQHSVDTIVFATGGNAEIDFQLHGYATSANAVFALDDVSLSILPSNSLLIPSVAVLPCDDECVMQPVQIQARDAIAGATIPIDIPDGVEVCGWSREGLITEEWDCVFDTVAENYALINLANFQGYVIEPGTTTVAYLLFHTQSECLTSSYIHWDTTLSDDPSRQLKFSDAFGQAVNPGFDFGRDSTEILGFTPGDFGNDGSVDIADLVALIDYMFRDGPAPCVTDAVDVNGDCGGPDIADLVYLINYMFLGGPVPECGCISNGVLARVAVNADIVVGSVFKDGLTTISLAAPFDLRGLDLQLAGPDGAAPVKLVGDALDMVFGQDGERVKIGILDLDGANVIPAGENRVIQIAGEYDVVSAVVATDGYHTYAATIGEAAKGGSLPSEYVLSQNYPNPFNPVTTISFSLPVASHVSLEVYNVMGQRVTTVADGFYGAGVHACEWDGSAVASGVYFYRIETPEFIETKKMMLLK